MKKMLSVLFVMLFVLTAGNALAGWGDWFGGCQNSWECAEEFGVSLTLNGQDVDVDKDFSTTGWKGNKNDEAFAKATGWSGFDVELYANGTDKKIIGYEEDIYEGENKRWKHGHWEYTGWFEKDGEYKYFSNRDDGEHGWQYVGAHKVEGDPIYSYKSNKAGVEGIGIAGADSHAWSYAKDYGTTSKAGAGAKTGGEVLVTGLAYGKDGCPEFITGSLWIGGEVYQRNEAGETDYSNGQFIKGGNESWASGTAGKDVNGFNFFGTVILLDGLYVKDAVQTKGSTYVTIDPYGSNRSFYGTTQNQAAVDFGRKLDLQSSYVGGQGGIGGMVTNGQGSYAAGQANFSYIGNTQGNGDATIKGLVTPSGVFVSGSAHAVGN